MKNELTAKRLTKALSDNNMRAQDLADATGINKASISQYVNGTHAPSNISAGKMGNVLKVSPLWLMGLDVPENNMRASIAGSQDAILLSKIKQLNPDERMQIESLVDLFLQNK